MQLKSFYEQEKQRFDQRIHQEKSKTERHVEEISEEYEKRIEIETNNHEEELQLIHSEFREMETFYTDEITKLNEKIELDSQKIDFLEKHIENLKSQLNSIYDSHSNAIELNQEGFNQQRQALFEKLENMAADLAEKDKNLIILRYAKEQVDRVMYNKTKDFEEQNEKYLREKNNLLDQLSKLKTDKDEQLLENSKTNSKNKRELALAVNENEMLQKKINELEIIIDEGENRYKESLRIYKEESGTDFMTQKIIDENGSLHQKITDSKKAYKLLLSQNAKVTSQNEKEKAILEENLSESLLKIQDLEKRIQESSSKSQNISKKSESIINSTEIDNLKIQIAKLDKELGARQISYERDKSLWENKFNLLLQQRDQARKELQIAQERFDIIVEEIKHKTDLEKDKAEAKMNAVVSQIEQKHSLTMIDLQNKNESSLKDLKDKLKQAERNIDELTADVEKEKREKASITNSLDRKIQQANDMIKQLENELDVSKEIAQDSLDQLLEKFDKEREGWKLRMTELEKKIKELENHKAQQFILHEKERAKWALEKESIMSNQSEAEHKLTSVLKRQDNLKKENEKLKTPRPRLIPKKSSEVSISTNISFDDINRYNSYSGKSTPTNISSKSSPRANFSSMSSLPRSPHQHK